MGEHHAPVKLSLKVEQRIGASGSAHGRVHFILAHAVQGHRQITEQRAERGEHYVVRAPWPWYDIVQ